MDPALPWRALLDSSSLLPAKQPGTLWAACAQVRCTPDAQRQGDARVRLEAKLLFKPNAPLRTNYFVLFRIPTRNGYKGATF